MEYYCDDGKFDDDRSDGCICGRAAEWRWSLSMGSEHMPFNDDQEYWMADGIYTVVKREAETGEIPEQQMTVGSGYAGYWPGQRMSSWVMCIEEGEFVKGGPVAAGTVTVTRDGDNYTFVVELADDFDFKITGVFTVLFDDVRTDGFAFSGILNRENTVVKARRIPPGFLYAAAFRRRMVGRVGHPSGSSERLRSGAAVPEMPRRMSRPMRRFRTTVRYREGDGGVRFP